MKLTVRIGAWDEFVMHPKEITKIAKNLGMPQWCRVIKDPAYKLVKNAKTQNYAVRPHNLITYDDQESLTAKINFVKEFGAGVGLHTVKTDDVNGECGCGRMPYLTYVVNVLKMWCESIPCF
ncbi:Hypothetical predicted protein [Cloeon dipterum]|uniref:Uncharacterized protein n=1 Tax=Cloeon dipterum TaxID=197152 RepID=A0A8S1BXK5_9INSE|nr:Hypothetical predicted protein [Cloeon dipterum]